MGFGYLRWGGPEEAGRSALNGALVTNTCTLTGCVGGRVAGTCVNWPPAGGGRGVLCDNFCGAFGLACVLHLLVRSTGFRDVRHFYY